MSIQFNRENAQQLWSNPNQKSKPAQTPLTKALSDHQLTHSEYQELKTAFLKEQPNGNFDQWLADALDGALDQKQSSSLQSALSTLSKQGNATSAISFELNASGVGYAPEALAKTYTQPDWSQAARAADSNHDGRLDAKEAARAELPDHLRQNLENNRAVLTYDDAQQQVTYYPATEQPQLNARYKDLKLTLDVDLKDIDGIGDRSRGDISGTTSGSLNFDWNGPLVDGIRKAVEEESGGWVEADTRWVDDKRKGGPGYIIQARSGVIATRPIVIKSNAAGEMYLESPGFGSSVRLRLGEHGLKKYALPKLREMGLDLKIERRDDRIYLTPQRLAVKNIPLTATHQQAASGELNLELAGHTRFEASASGLKATFSNVPVKGSSQVNGAAAVADQAPDRISGRIEAGLNYDLNSSRLDTEVVLKNTTVALSLDAKEMREQLYLPRTLAEQAGDHLTAKLTLNGSYRTVNGQQHEGKAEGFMELQGEGTQAYGRIKGGIGETRLALSAMGVQHQQAKQQGQQGQGQSKLQATAQQGALNLDKPATPSVDLHSVKANAQIEQGPLLTQVKNLLNGPQPVSLQLRAVLTHAGISDGDLEALAEGKADALGHLLSSKTWLSKIEQAVVTVSSDHSRIEMTPEGLTTHHKGVSVSARDGDEQIAISAQIDQLDTQSNTQPQGNRQNISAQNTRVHAHIDFVDADAGSVNLDAELQSAQSSLNLFKNEQTPTENTFALSFQQSNARVDLVAQTHDGPELRLAANTTDMSLRVTEKDVKIASQEVAGNAQYTSNNGSKIDLEGKAQGAQLTQNKAGEWQVTVPNAEARLQVDLALSTLKELLQGAEIDALAALPHGRSQAETQSQLRTAGLNPDQARQAAGLLWKPELQHLLKTSDFIDALKQAEHLTVTSEITGSLSLENRTETGFKATADTHVSTRAALKTSADSETAIVQSEAEAQIKLQSNDHNTQISTPELTVKAQAQQQDGTDIGSFEARIAALDSAFSGEQQSLTSGEVSAQVNFSSVLDTEKIAQIQNLLTDFKDDLLLRLDKIGLNRQQFENILQAFGKNQVEALFKALKPEDVAAMSEDLGLSQKQVTQLMSLLREEPFQKVVQNVFAYSELLTDAQANVSVQLKSESSSWSRKDQQMLASLHNTHLHFGAESSTAQGGGSLNVELSQSQMDYTQNGADAKLSWGPQQASATGRLQREDNGEIQESFDMDLQFNGEAGQVERKQGTFRTEMGASDAQVKLNQTQADGSQGSMVVNASVEHVSSQGSATAGEGEVKGLKVRAQSALTDSEYKGEVSGSGELSIDALHVKPKAVIAEGMTVEAQAQSAYAFTDAQKSEGDAQVHFATERLESSTADGVQMQEATFNTTAHTRLEKEGNTRAEMTLAAREGSLKGLHAQNGKVDFDSLHANLEQQIKTPMARGAVEGRFAMEGYHSENKVQQADTFRLDDVEGTLHIKSDHLRKLLSRSKDAQSVLETISKRWTTEGDAPQFFTNDEVTLHIDQGRWEGDNSDGDALDSEQTLSAHLNLPDLETRLGSTKLQINLNRLSLDSENKTEVELSGKAEFSPHQPEFDQSIQALIDRSLKAAGLNLKPEVHFVDGKFEVKIDRWFVDGLVNVDFSGDNIEISVDRAKLLHFLNTRNLATRLSESQVNNYLLDVQREGNVLNLSLNEFSQSLLHRDNLNIQSVSTESGKIEAEFSYTDTRAYNAGYQGRQQEKLERRLFNTDAGEARSERSLENRVEDLSQGALQRVFKSASTQQLQKMLSAVGGDYDNVLRKALKNENQWQDYPVPNRAIMAANLARNSGLFERVDSEEKQLIQKLVGSLKPSEQALFTQSVSPEAYQQIMKYVR